MTITRRGVLAAGVTGTIALSAGCVGFVLGNEPLEFNAAQAAPSDETLEATGFEESEVSREGFNEPIDIGVRREVSASIWISTYTKSVDIFGTDEEAAFFSAISIPAIEIMGRSFNPVSDMDHQDLVEEFEGELESEIGDLRDIRHEETITLAILGDEREADRFLAETDVQNQEITIELIITGVEHEDDLVILIGGYPEALRDEAANVEQLFESVAHPITE